MSMPTYVMFMYNLDPHARADPKRLHGQSVRAVSLGFPLAGSSPLDTANARVQSVPAAAVVFDPHAYVDLGRLSGQSVRAALGSSLAGPSPLDTADAQAQSAPAAAVVFDQAPRLSGVAGKGAQSVPSLPVASTNGSWILSDVVGEWAQSVLSLGNVCQCVTDTVRLDQ
ncbi:hypothetical protein BOTBODRAFT_186067 [Botryobasidium botryosum FD-172 SS1]|uniref:Uncharacterized protein n=1 Tax=Botryobasidium botryosum (strain FD-172 SS1) TaxID=930990 RepID=A0A067MNU3_BOTB1|nr:hypothetical protein BOTBODRAFT_186067 [Botryobasidium botryosum FD-172 SS1]